jgi:hypothetical protein
MAKAVVASIVEALDGRASIVEALDGRVLESH